MRPGQPKTTESRTGLVTPLLRHWETESRTGLVRNVCHPLHRWGAQKSLDIETAMAKLFASPEQQRVEETHPFTIEEVAKLSPSMHLPRFINAMAGTFHSAGDTIASKISIMIRNEDYFRHISDFVGTVPLDEIKAYLLFRCVYFRDEACQREGEALVARARH